MTASAPNFSRLLIQVLSTGMGPATTCYLRGHLRRQGHQLTSAQARAALRKLEAAGEVRRSPASNAASALWEVVNLPGSARRCPRCLSLRTHTVTFDQGGFYKGRQITGCVDCRSLWEPLPEGYRAFEAQWPFEKPCDNCAFRKGSPEQSDPETWAQVMANVKAFAGFYCHKGVPLSKGDDVGFAYPKKPDGTYDARAMRTCRGYLNAMGKELKS
ncbi:hypothetical protein D3874_03140 [Oleomonas cavernae]|uniref:Uncharacterized protein n=1 Tax=Oleomonas cavernae TaxID=2320859 RepID=A0A418WU79_9PROT|nr:FaeA/PapI family transcriptional regulator [Oleomonas cavernae]RJF94823.1 hypothetical protein D3874_03140 [Oleomonas cavernae]